MEIKQINPEEVEQKLKNDETLNIIDVREDDEVAEGMIPEAVHIRMGDIPDFLDKLDKNEEYIITCHAGGRSMRVCQFLQEEGFHVINMTGGMSHWTGETKPKL